MRSWLRLDPLQTLVCWSRRSNEDYSSIITTAAADSAADDTRDTWLRVFVERLG